MSVELSQAAPGTGGAVGTAPSALATGETTGPWRTVVHNDPVNLMSYVVYVFRRHFGYSREVAEGLMMQVHEEGRAVVSRGSRERMEIDVQAMHSYGLRATIERAGED
ncbi:ATP-dependent Clp protease adapter ClpS [Brachybacterium sp. DNPG3]